MVSIIIPTYNEEGFLPLLLESIRSQKYQNYEIIIADANSTDKTRIIASDYGCQIIEGGLPAAGRNRGAEVANGDLLLFLDADVVLPNNFLTDFIKGFNNSTADAATCFITPLSQKRIDIILHRISNHYIWYTKNIYPHASGFCILIKKNIHRLIGGFNEKLKLAEDHEYIKRVANRSNYSIVKEARIMVSIRRLEKEGRLILILKYLLVEVHRLVRGEIYTDIFKYSFGHSSTNKYSSTDCAN